MNNKLAPFLPSEVLLEEFLTPIGISQNHLAIQIDVPARLIKEIVLGSAGSRRILQCRWPKVLGQRPNFG
jgi:antitoxin HigA-1